MGAGGAELAAPRGPSGSSRCPRAPGSHRDHRPGGTWPSRRARSSKSAIPSRGAQWASRSRSSVSPCARMMPTTSRHCRSDTSPPRRYHSSFRRMVGSAESSQSSSPGLANPHARPMPEALDVERVAPGDEDVHLHRAPEVDQVKARAGAGRVGYQLRVDVVAVAQGRQQRSHMRRPEIDHQVHVVGRAWLAVKRTGQGPRGEIADLQPLEDPRDRERDRERIRESVRGHRLARASRRPVRWLPPPGAVRRAGGRAPRRAPAGIGGEDRRGPSGSRPG